jgi:hypothetical protein
LERRDTGIRFHMIDEQERIRPHIVIFVNENGMQPLNGTARATDRAQIVAALSGG